MNWWRRLLKRGEMERHLDAELRFHFDGLVADNLRAGMSEPEACRSARLEFGGVEQVKEECRDARGTRLVEDLWQDLLFALRTLHKSPGFAIAVIGTLALGIGASIGIFSVVDTILLKPLRAPAADRIVRIMDSFQGVPSPTPGLPEFNELRRQTQVFEYVSAYRLDLMNLTGRSNPELLPVARVSFGFFQLFGAPILHGRIFSEEEDRPGGPRVVLLSYEMWQRTFGNDPQTIGKALTFGTDSYTVVGILAPGFDTEQFSQLPSAWIPFQIDPDTPEHGSFCYVAGRLKSGIAPAVAIAQLGPAATEYRAKFPGYNQNFGFTVQPLREAMVSDVRSSLLVLAGAVIFVLLIACSNVANLFLVRLEGRRREIAIRAAMGGGVARIMRQLITESLVLSLAGGTFGLLMGSYGIRALLRFYPSAPLIAAWNPINLPRIGQAGSAVAVDWRVIVFTIFISMLTGLLFGTLPAFRASLVDLNAPLKEGSGRSGTSLRQNKVRALLVISEMTLAFVMLVGALLLIRTYVNLRSVNPGFDGHDVLTMQMSLTATRFEKTAEMDRLVRDGAQRISALPGVETVGAACCLPLETVWQLPFIVVGRPLSGPFHGYAGWTFISPKYFDAFHVPLTRGRAFTDGDNALAPRVVIINEAMAHLLSPKGDPLNERLIIGRGMRPEYEKDTARQIVGVVGDIRDQSLNRRPRPAMYVPVAQLPDEINIINLRLLPIAWFIRTRVEPQSLSTLIQNELRQASGGLPVTSIRSMDEIERRSVARQNFSMLLMTIFASAAVLLAAIGIYGLMAYSVQQQTREIGIRMALGAQPGALRSMVLRQGMRLALIGVAIGIGAALGLTRLLASLLFGVQPRDPLLFTVVPVLLIAVAWLACYLPARRATRINPLDALRWE